MLYEDDGRKIFSPLSVDGSDDGFFLFKPGDPEYDADFDEIDFGEDDF